MSDLIDRQAALDALRSRQTYLFDSKDPDKKIELRSAEMAIEELPTVQPDHTADSGKKVSISCGRENDLISRQAAIDALDEQIEQCNKALGSFDISPKDEYAIKVERASLKAYRELLENLPTAQPEQNEKWIYNSPTTMKCDRCGFAIKDWDWHRFKYCPNCGADMRGGDST